MSARPFTTGDTVRYSGPTPDIDGKTGVVVGRWIEDQSVIDVEIDGARWSIPAARLTLVQAAPASVGPFTPLRPVLVDGGREGRVTSVHDGLVWVSIKDPMVNTGWRPANGYEPADVQLLDAPLEPLPAEAREATDDAPAAVPALVQLDQAESHAESRLIKAALAWEASEHGTPWDHADAEDELRAAAHDYRKVTNR